MNLLFADTETTGTEEEDRLCQLCFHINGAEANALYKPPLPIKVGAMAVHHITNRMVEDKPPFAGSQEYHVLTHMQNQTVFVAHNAKFDLEILAKEGLVFDQMIDTLKVSRHLDKEGLMESHKLQYLRYYYGLEIDAVAHDAMGDVRVLMAVFDKLRGALQAAENLDSETTPARMMEISQKPSLIRRFNFGKHKGLLVEEVEKRDRGYLRWLQNEKQKDPKDEEDWLYTLEFYLGDL